ncbi:MAG: hypothetical protein DRR16_21755 [Candidatus Parabeggiatoa sp. nov. 3]|nr:MAG: hypothetical protein DRR00_13375 [Gammaproteobacteria bacterium]RKZ60430.1 MAG: hypothetical protein DRQ99_22075 [Gammaproteobacteria bacterium]RKZ81604.1 MAG: hypothetical protein DRR16_21755 [Gammaproteobacteria bacterium]
MTVNSGNLKFFVGAGLQPAPSLFLNRKKSNGGKNVLDGVVNWGVKFEPIYWFIFHSIFLPNGGMVGKRAVT